MDQVLPSEPSPGLLERLGALFAPRADSPPLRRPPAVFAGDDDAYTPPARSPSRHASSPGVSLSSPGSGKPTSPCAESPQAITKAALSAYKGSALEKPATLGGAEDATPPSSQHEDRKLIALLLQQLRRNPRAESSCMMLNVAQLLARTPRNVSALLPAAPHVLSSFARSPGHAELHESGLGLLGNLASAPESLAPLAKCAVLENAVAALQRHADHAGVARAAYRTIRNLASASEHGLEACTPTLLSGRIPQLISFLMHRHLPDAEAIAQALACLWSFAASPQLAMVLCESCAPSGVLRCLAHHPSCAPVLRFGCGALAQLLHAAAAAGAADAQSNPSYTHRPHGRPPGYAGPMSFVGPLR